VHSTLCYTEGVDGDGGRDWLAQARRGVIELCVLLLLDRQPTYGYQLALALGAWHPLAAPEGTLYPLLRRLTRQGLVQAEWQASELGPPRKYYRLTPLGTQVLHAQFAEWQQLTQAVAALRTQLHEDEEVPDGSARSLAVSGPAPAQPHQAAGL